MLALLDLVRQALNFSFVWDLVEIADNGGRQGHGQGGRTAKASPDRDVGADREFHPSGMIGAQVQQCFANGALDQVVVLTATQGSKGHTARVAQITMPGFSSMHGIFQQCLRPIAAMDAQVRQVQLDQTGACGLDQDAAIEV
ncbi:hypothetical protein D3C76_856460 [compost metagenome]